MMLNVINSEHCNSPTGIVNDIINKKIIVIDNEYHRIQLFDEQMIPLDTIGTKGINFGHFNSPQGLCLQYATGNIIISDTGNNRIQVFSNYCEKIKKLYMTGNRKASQELGKFNYPVGVTCNNRGHIWVADCDNKRVQIFNEKGIFIRQLIAQFDMPHDVYFDRNQNQILAADCIGKRISIWSNDGSQLIRKIPLSDRPYCSTIDHLNRLIIGFDNKISIFDMYLNEIISFDSLSDSSNKFKGIGGLCITDENNLLVCDYWNNRVLKCKI